MALCEYVQENIHLSESLTPGLYGSSDNEVSFSAASTVLVTALLTAQMSFAATLDEAPHAPVQETVQLASHVLLAGTTTEDATGRLRLRDRLTYFEQQAALAHVELSASAWGFVKSGLTSEVVFRSEAGSTVAFDTSLQSGARFTDAVQAYSGQSVESGLLLDSEVTTKVRSTTTNTDTLVFNDEWVETVRYYTLLTSTAHFTSSLFTSGVTCVQVVEGVEFADDAWSIQTEGVAWVMNSVTTGVSCYRQFPFDNVVEFAGAWYGCRADGIYALEGDTDAGEPIRARIETRLLDFGVNNQKRILGGYLSYRASEPLQLTVGVHGQPYTGAASYMLDGRDVSIPRVNRVVVAKGLSSNYWQFAVSNPAGGDFSIDNLQVEVAVAARRV